MSLIIRQYPCRSDNYGYLLHDPESGDTACVDTPGVKETNDILDVEGWRLTHIFNTHWHDDHAGGNLALKEKWSCKIVGSAIDPERIPGLDVEVGDGDKYTFAGRTVQVFDVSGHTNGHISFYFGGDDALFCGDALFALGCGRLFEGTPSQMWTSLQKLMALPDNTRVYCAHEYTQANAAFALTVEPDNEALQARAREIDALRAQQKPTVPSTIGEEKATNPFLRPMSQELQMAIDKVDAPLDEVFAETRRRKDNF
ncbi:MAG: hydroxyacylglutathione hydrolase [Pseudomonadota bacterium]|nr:hydroxyacylglutathione hydrolase [Pseudomonadota bacterium]